MLTVVQTINEDDVDRCVQCGLKTDRGRAECSRALGREQTVARRVWSDCNHGNTPDRSHDAGRTGTPPPRP